MVLEQCAAPLDLLAISLAGAEAGRVAFSDVFASTLTPFYFMQNTTQWECGIGTLIHGTPDTLQRTTVLANSNGDTARVVFVGSVYVYNTIPSAYAVHLGTFNPSYVRTLSSADYFTTLMPGGIREIVGSNLVTTGSNGVATITFPVAFTGYPIIVVSNGDATITETPVYLYSYDLTTIFVICPGRLSDTYRVNWIAKGVA